MATFGTCSTVYFFFFFSFCRMHAAGNDDHPLYCMLVSQATSYIFNYRGVACETNCMHAVYMCLHAPIVNGGLQTHCDHAAWINKQESKVTRKQFRIEQNQQESKL